MGLRDALTNTWGKILIIFLPFFLAGMVGSIKLVERVTQLERETVRLQTTQVTHDELKPQLDLILREITGLREDLRDLRRVR